MSLLLVDIDRFKDINEALGHDTGDRVLAEVGCTAAGGAARGATAGPPRRRRVRRPAARGGRAGRPPGGRPAAPVAGRPDRPPELPATPTHQPPRLTGHPNSPAIELTSHPELTSDPERDRRDAAARAGQRRASPPASCAAAGPQDLLRQADVAVARAKAAGTGVEVFEPDRDRIDTTRLRRTDELRAALERGDLEVYLQPQVDLATGTVVGAEALARWRHPQDGVLLPASFLPLAARTGLLRPVAALVLDRATAACARWWSLRLHRSRSAST